MGVAVDRRKTGVRGRRPSVAARWWAWDPGCRRVGRSDTTSPDDTPASPPARSAGRHVARQPSTTYELARRLVEHDRPVLAADDDVLDPGAVLAREVDPGLDAEGHPGTQRQVVARDDVRVLVPLETDAVPSPMEERLVRSPPRRSRRRAAASTASQATPGRTARVASRLGVVEDAEQVSGTPRRDAGCRRRRSPTASA